MNIIAVQIPINIKSNNVDSFYLTTYSCFCLLITFNVIFFSALSERTSNKNKNHFDLSSAQPDAINSTTLRITMPILLNEYDTHNVNCYTFIEVLNAPLLTTDIYHWMKINRFPFREQIDWLGQHSVQNNLRHSQIHSGQTWWWLINFCYKIETKRKQFIKTKLQNCINKTRINTINRPAF